MKTALVSALLALTLGTTTPTFALTTATNPVTDSVLFQTALRALPDGTGLEVAVNNTSAQKITVRLLNASGETLAIQFLSKQPQTSRIRFDLTAVPSGTYRVEITAGSTKQVKSVTLASPEPVRSVVVS